ncbi:MAG: hypothetical protein WCJ87_14030 [Burkholderiales bacterium]
MSRLSKVLTGVFVAALCVPVPQAQAALVDRGGGMLYDTVLNVTWLQDANYAKTSNYDADGRMTWTQANTWANNLNYGGYSSGWRLARNTPVNGTLAGWNYNDSFDGSTDVSYNITSTFSELSYMYYVNLGLKGYYSTSGNPQSGWGIFGNGTYGGQNNVGLVRNLQSYVYWSGTAYAPSPADLAWYFGANSGYQDNYVQSDGFFAWAVRPGDVTVAAVPVPGSVALLAGGLALLGVVTRRRWRLGASET